MKVLLTTPAGTGHVQPMVPLARAFVGRGHDVLWALPERAAGAVSAAGLRVAGVPMSVSTNPVDIMERYPELREHSPDVRPDFMFAKMFGATYTPVMLAGLLDATRDWRPDLVVCDAAELAGHIVAAELGVPSVTKSFGPLLPAVRYARADAEIAAQWSERGLTPRPLCGAFDTLYVDIYPPALPQPEWDGPPFPRQLMRPVTDNGPAVEGDLPLPVGDSPLVYLTMGTVFNNAAVLHAIVAAVAELDVRLLVTVGYDGEPAAVPARPNVRVERYVPQSQVLPACSVVISHAGSGTSLTALALGLPQLCLPQGADQFLNAAAIAKAGAGLFLSPDEASAEAIGDAVRRLLDDPSFAQAATRVGASIRAMPTPEEVAGVLERLVA